MSRFREQLEDLKKHIIKKANGVTCGTCEHADIAPGSDIGFCKIVEHVLRWGPITISTEAPRCDRYVPKKKVKKRQNCAIRETIITGQ